MAYKIPYDVKLNAPSTSMVVRLADGAAIPRDVLNGDYVEFLDWEASGGSAEVEANPLSSVPNEVEFWRFMLAAALLGIITPEEAEAATKSRILPTAFADAFDALPPEQGLAARIKFAGVTRMVRTDGLFSLLVQLGKVTDVQIDAVFTHAATLQ